MPDSGWVGVQPVAARSRAGARGPRQAAAAARARLRGQDGDGHVGLAGEHRAGEDQGVRRGRPEVGVDEQQDGHGPAPASPPAPRARRLEHGEPRGARLEGGSLSRGCARAGRRPRRRPAPASAVPSVDPSSTTTTAATRGSRPAPDGGGDPVGLVLRRARRPPTVPAGSPPTCSRPGQRRVSWRLTTPARARRSSAVSGSVTASASPSRSAKAAAGCLERRRRRCREAGPRRGRAGRPRGRRRRSGSPRRGTARRRRAAGRGRRAARPRGAGSTQRRWRAGADLAPVGASTRRRAGAVGTTAALARSRDSRTSGVSSLGVGQPEVEAGVDGRRRTAGRARGRPAGGARRPAGRPARPACPGSAASAAQQRGGGVPARVPGTALRSAGRRTRRRRRGASRARPSAARW